MFEELNERRKAVECNIAKGFGMDDAVLDLEKALEDEFEKGRAKKQFNIGDTFTRHGITYKCTGISANTGRPTWSKVKDGEGGKQEQPEKKEDKKDEQPKQEQKKRYLLKPDGTPIDMSKETDDNLSFTRTIIKNNIKNYKDKLDKLSPGAKKSRQIVEADIEKQEGMLAEVEEEIERRKKQATQQSKKPAKSSSFVTKTVEKLKDVLKYRNLSEEKIEEFRNAIISDEGTAKTFLSLKFPAAGSVGPDFSYFHDKDIVNLNENEDIILSVSKSYNTTSRYAGSRGTVSTDYDISLKDKRSGKIKHLGFSHASNSSFSKMSSSQAKNECIMEAMYYYFTHLNSNV